MMSALPEGSKMIATGVITPFLVPIKVAMMVAFMITLPFTLYQAWSFVAPGLYNHEKSFVLPLVVASTLLFVIGIAFCYFFVFNTVFHFINQIAPKSISVAPDIENYLNFVLTMFLAFGLDVRNADCRRHADAHGDGDHRAAARGATLFHRHRVCHRRGGYAAGRGVAAAAGGADVSAV